MCHQTENCAGSERRAYAEVTIGEKVSETWYEEGLLSRRGVR